MKGTHTLAELRGTKGFFMHSNGTVTTRYGSSTVNYWQECADGKYINYDCKTIS